MSDDRLSRIENKIDKLDDRLDAIGTTLAAQHVTLEEHIRRTENLETRMEPVENHVKQAGWLSSMTARVIAFGVSLATMIGGVIVLLEYLRKK